MSKKVCLGINSAGFNTSCSLFIDNKLFFAVEEERLNREKRTRKFPIKAVKYIFEKFSLKLEDIDFIAIGWNPAINLENLNTAFNFGQTRFLGEIFHNVVNNFINFDPDVGDMSEQIIHYKKKKIHIFFVRHHLAHASSYYLSDFTSSSILTIDAFGEKQCTEFFLGNGSKISSICSQEFPHSLGSFYSAFTSFMGFKPQSDEWKLMGASAYGEEKRFLKKLEELIYPIKDGFELNLNYFNHFQFHRPGLFSDKLIDHLGIKPNEHEKKLSKEYYDLSAGVQKTFENICIHLMRRLFKFTQNKNLVFSGGCALNCSLNGKILSNTPYKKVFIPPFPDDSGVAIGSALFVNHTIFNKKKVNKLIHNYLGPSFSDNEIKKILETYKLNFKFLNNPEKVAVRDICEGKVIGWFQGGLEFGDRSLGNRSILADPRRQQMKDKVNYLIKYREGFRPFAPSVLENKVSDFFINVQDSFFMSKTLQVKKEKQKLIPAVVHVDGSARLQTVSKKINPKFYNLINNFYKVTKIPILLNTSFNVKGEPIVCSPQDAIRTFFSSGLDVLFLNNFYISKK